MSAVVGLAVVAMAIEKSAACLPQYSHQRTHFIIIVTMRVHDLYIHRNDASLFLPMRLADAFSRRHHRPMLFI